MQPITLLLLNLICSSALIANERWVLASRPRNNGLRASDLRLEAEELREEELADEEVIVRVDTLSIEAFYRTTFDEEAYHGSTELGALAPALGVGEVVAAGKKAKHKPGARVVGMLGAQRYARVPSGQMNAAAALPGSTPTDALGRLGISGLTAWVGIAAVTKPPTKRDVVVVSAAAGATGSLAAQLAKARGARVIGVAGGASKCAFLTEKLGLDGAVDYKRSNETLGEQLDRLAPEGVDFFFDNVGGDILDAVLPRMRRKGRIVICGGIAHYNSGDVNKGTVKGPSQYLKLAEKARRRRSHLPSAAAATTTPASTLSASLRLLRPATRRARRCTAST